MKIKYDKEVDILIIRFTNKKVKESDESKPGVILDYDEAGHLVKIEILDASKRTKVPPLLEYEEV